MSVISLQTAKQYLDVIHSADDEKLQILLDGAEDEAEQFINRGLTEIADGEPPSSVVVGVMLLLQAAYQAKPEEAQAYRSAAEVKLMPYRVGMGV